MQKRYTRTKIETELRDVSVVISEDSLAILAAVARSLSAHADSDAPAAASGAAEVEASAEALASGVDVRESMAEIRSLVSTPISAPPKIRSQV